MAIEKKYSLRYISKLSKVPVSTLHGWIKKHNETGNYEADIKGGSKKKLDHLDKLWLGSLLKRFPYDTCSQLSKKLEEMGGNKVSSKTISRNLKEMGYVFGKIRNKHNFSLKQQRARKIRLLFI